MKAVHMGACLLLWVGGINWGLIGLFNYNLVEAVFPMMLVKWVYILVGLSAVLIAVTHKADCKTCSN